VETRAGLRLPWLDVVPVIIYMGYAWLFISAYHLSTWQRRRRTTADDKAIGGRLKFARQSAGLTLSSVSDELAIRYDYLEQYEDGERPLRLDHGRLLAQRFGLTLSELLGTKA